MLNVDESKFVYFYKPQTPFKLLSTYIAYAIKFYFDKLFSKITSFEQHFRKQVFVRLFSVYEF